MEGRYTLADEMDHFDSREPLPFNDLPRTIGARRGVVARIKNTGNNSPDDCGERKNNVQKALETIAVRKGWMVVGGRLPVRKRREGVRKGKTYPLTDAIFKKFAETYGKGDAHREAREWRRAAEYGSFRSRGNIWAVVD